MRTVHLPAASGIQMPSRILLEVEIYPDPEAHNHAVDDLHNALEEHLTPEALTKLGELLHKKHPSN